MKNTFGEIKVSPIRNLSNIPGWRTNRRIVVFESDDWGSIRMPSRLAFRNLSNAGMDLKGFDALRYNLYDTLETSSDLELLFQLLGSVRDSANNPAVFTAVSVMANPDFKKIKENGYRQYFYEPFTETLKKNYSNNTSFTCWKEGIREHVFIPQFHGREHLNVSEWMKALRNNDREAHLAFELGTWTYIPKLKNRNGPDFLAAFQLIEMQDLEKHKEILKDGLRLFEELFDFKPQYFVPPNGVINNKLNLTCYKSGVRYRSTSKIQHESVGKGRTRKILHWLGQKDSNGIRYIVRNCVFEPNRPGRDWVDSCLTEIKIAFRWNHPAIINTHRVNYIGYHDVSNRDNGLKELRRLLTSIKRYWPDVEFMTTTQLGSVMDG